MSRLSYARVFVELDLLVDLKSFVDIFLPNGAPLTQPLCKVLGHKMGACSLATTSIVTSIWATKVSPLRLLISPVVFLIG
ncbi:hypothetical protein NC651_003813 [Populus alba x Populus x berolinensis]|nr:hypothetical protein NC651_003813 [Populus alba x Populus x berolinensis]